MLSKQSKVVEEKDPLNTDGDIQEVAVIRPIDKVVGSPIKVITLDGTSTSPSPSRPQQPQMKTVKVPSTPEPEVKRRPGKKSSVDLGKPAFKKPMEKGWKREVVYRCIVDSGNRADIYYYTPTNKKLRSSREVAEYLQKEHIKELTLENFTFFKQPLGGLSRDKEIVRNASNRAGPVARKPKPAPPAGSSVSSGAGHKDKAGTPDKTPAPVPTGRRPRVRYKPSKYRFIEHAKDTSVYTPKGIKKGTTRPPSLKYVGHSISEVDSWKGRSEVVRIPPRPKVVKAFIGDKAVKVLKKYGGPPKKKVIICSKKELTNVFSTYGVKPLSPEDKCATYTCDRGRVPKSHAEALFEKLPSSIPIASKLTPVSCSIHCVPHATVPQCQCVSCFRLFHPHCVGFPHPFSPEYFICSECHFDMEKLLGPASVTVGEDMDVPDTEPTRLPTLHKAPAAPARDIVVNTGRPPPPLKRAPTAPLVPTRPPPPLAIVDSPRDTDVSQGQTVMFPRGGQAAPLLVPAEVLKQGGHFLVCKPLNHSQPGTLQNYTVVKNGTVTTS